MRTPWVYKTSNLRSTTSKTLVALKRVKSERGSCLSNYRNAANQRKSWGSSNSMITLV